MEQTKQKANDDQSARARIYEKGSLVWLHCPAIPRGKCPKFHQPWQGPFKVVKKIGDVVYRIQHTQTPKDELWYTPTGSRITIHTQRKDEFQQWVIPPGWIEQTKSASRENFCSPERTTDGQAESEPEVEQLPSPPQQDTSPLPLRQSNIIRRPPHRYRTIVSFRDSDSEFEN